MNVQQLLDRLNKVKDKGKPIMFFLDFEKLVEVDSLSDNMDELLLGNDLPPESYESDYKYD